MYQVFKQDTTGFSLISEYEVEQDAIDMANALPLDFEIRVEERDGGSSRTVLVLTPPVVEPQE